MPAVKLIPNGVGAHVFTTKIEGKDHNFIIDTGADATVVSEDLIRGYEPIAWGTHMGIGGGEKTYMVDARLRLLGKTTDHLTKGAMFNQEFYRHIGMRISGLIGRDVLNQFKSYTFDNREKVFRWEP